MPQYRWDHFRSPSVKKVTNHTNGVTCSFITRVSQEGDEMESIRVIGYIDEPPADIGVYPPAYRTVPPKEVQDLEFGDYLPDSQKGGDSRTVWIWVLCDEVLADGNICGKPTKIRNVDHSLHKCGKHLNPHNGPYETRVITMLTATKL